MAPNDGGVDVINRAIVIPHKQPMINLIVWFLVRVLWL
jgi:hypothetical protein